MTGKASLSGSCSDNDPSIEHDRHRSAVQTYIEQEKKKLKFVRSTFCNEVTLHVTPFKRGVMMYL